jgi:hypothetical protein
MKKWISRTNKKYDKLAEPWRFLIAFLVVLPFLILTNCKNKYLMILGSFWVLCFVLWRMIAFCIANQEDIKKDKSDWDPMKDDPDYMG